MYKGHRTAVVMPVHNEEGFIERAVSRVPDFVDLIIAVDDGSKDTTWTKLSEFSDSRLVRLRHRANRGVGAATVTGYRAAIEYGIELIAVMDGDGQMDGRDLHLLLDSAISGADFVKGNRFLDEQSIDEMPPARYICKRFFSWLTRRAAGFDASLDAQCGYTVIRRAALKRINLDGLYDRYGFPNEMLFAALGAGLKVECVPVKSVYGSEVSGINPFTSVPTILYLIARGWLRGRFAVKTRRRAIAIPGGERVSEIGR
jgi:glycosyltransferase involved in cell wall biosynthesis